MNSELETESLGKILRKVLELIFENDELKQKCRNLEDKYFKLEAEYEAYTARHRDRPIPFNDMGCNH